MLLYFSRFLYHVLAVIIIYASFSSFCTDLSLPAWHSGLVSKKVSLTISIRIVVLILLLEQSLFVVQFRFSFQELLTPSYSVVFGVVLIFVFSPRACL